MATETEGCPTCKGSRGVVPSAFAEDAVAWPDHLDQIKAHMMTTGFPSSSYPAWIGMLKPRPCPTCCEEEMAKHSPEETIRAGHAIEYRSPAGFLTYQSWSGAREGIVRSVQSAIAVAFWPTAAEAAAWLGARGLADGGTVPVGTRTMVARVVETTYEAVREGEPHKGLVFEIPREKSDVPPARGAQAAFAFGD